jgi:hypothetical protein
VPPACAPSSRRVETPARPRHGRIARYAGSGGPPCRRMPGGTSSRKNRPIRRLGGCQPTGKTAPCATNIAPLQSRVVSLQREPPGPASAHREHQQIPGARHADGQVRAGGVRRHHADARRPLGNLLRPAPGTIAGQKHALPTAGTRRCRRAERPPDARPPDAAAQVGSEARPRAAAPARRRARRPARAARQAQDRHVGSVCAARRWPDQPPMQAGNARPRDRAGELESEAEPRAAAPARRRARRPARAARQAQDRHVGSARPARRRPDQPPMQAQNRTRGCGRRPHGADRDRAGEAQAHQVNRSTRTSAPMRRRQPPSQPSRWMGRAGPTHSSRDTVRPIDQGRRTRPLAA